MKLNFGDIFTVTKLRNDISGGLAIFTFERRSYPENWEASDKISTADTTSAAGSNVTHFTLDRNHLIFSKIMSYLSVRSLKNARLVSRKWKKQVTPILRKKSALTFDDPRAPNASRKFLRYVHDIKKVTKWPHWKISFPALPAKGNDKENWRNKYVTDLNWFLQPKRDPLIKTLSLKGAPTLSLKENIKSNHDYRLYLGTVSQLKDTLEELCLDVSMRIWKNDGTEKKYYSTRPDLRFNKLQKFSLVLDDLCELNLDTVTANWMETWADAITRVISLSIVGARFLGTRFVQELGTTGTARYQNLREILITCKPEDAINFLIGVNQPLTKVTLTLPLQNRHLPEFENLLKKFAPSLELLDFRVATDGMEEKSRFVLHLPCFPKLKSLDFHFGTFKDTPYYTGPDCVDCRVKNVARVGLEFPPRDHVNNGIDYGRHLPEIRSIVVTPYMEDEDVDGDEDDFWETYSDLMDSLVPLEKGQCCKTLKNFDILRRNIEPETKYRQASRLQGIFPNVRNEWMDRLRGKIDN
ncbi:uncharacterized protein LOC118436880 [Folsomia candida]|uniref:uncharacterized protein LOC118436880 n=1 Tax=Folsomia candida TaxID=158441 RepID=UPI001604E457|nr:uncharacterized protein LOC118436880 [Folsomia candida]